MKIEIKNKSERLISIPLMVILGVVTIVHLSITYLLSQRLSQQVTDYESVVNHNIAMDKVILKRLEPVYIQLPNATKIKAIREDFNKSNSLWFYVSKKNNAPAAYIPDNLINPNLPSAGNFTLRSDIVPFLIEMFKQGQEEGVNLKIGSAYRSYDYQTSLFNSNAQKYGVAITNQTIALPGQSEHQLGLAVDLVSNDNSCYIETCFESQKEGLWLASNSYKYGFVLRYPKDKETVTGYSYEPWHFRFVGIDLSSALFESKLTFDEVQPYLSEALFKLKENGSKLRN